MGVASIVCERNVNLVLQAIWRAQAVENSIYGHEIGF